nr:MAG TPA: hypothetical protein [Caudoviricetes sp.]
MTTITFPKRLPYPTVESYSIRPDEAIIRTDMEAGPARQRRRYTQTPSKIAVKWIMSPEQFCLFEAWYKYYAKEGAEWFVITLLGGIGLTEQEARFTQQFEASITAGRLWQITTELEIRDRPTITEDATLIIMDSDFQKLEMVTNRLHILVHKTLPIKLN